MILAIWVFGRRIQISGHSDLGIFKKLWYIFHVDLHVSGYCSCLTWTSWNSGFDVHDSRLSFVTLTILVQQYCVRTRIIFYIVTSEHDSSLVLLLLRFQLRILEITNIHQWREMNKMDHTPCFSDHFFLVADFRQLPCQNFLQFFTLFYHCCLCIWTFSLLEASEGICEQDCSESENSSLFSVTWSWWCLCTAPSSLGLVLSSASTIQANRVRRFPILRWVSLLLLMGILQGIAAVRYRGWHRNFQLSTSGFACEL